MAVLLRNLLFGSCCDLAGVLKPSLQFVEYGTTCKVRARKTSKKWASPCQRTRRTSWKAIPALWNRLLPYQKDCWKYLALSTYFLNHCNEPLYLHAYQMFCRVNGVLLNFGEPFLLADAPISYDPPVGHIDYTLKFLKLPYSTSDLLGLTFVSEDYKGFQLFTYKGWHIPPSEFCTKARLIFADTDDYDALGDLPDMSTFATWTAPPLEYGCTAVFYDGAFIYAGMGPFDGRLFKINPATMMSVGMIPGLGIDTSLVAFTTDGNDLYAGYYTYYAQVHKIATAYLRVTDSWTGGDEEMRCTSLCYDGTYLYAGFYYGLWGVTKIDPNTMESVAHLPEAAFPYYVRALVTGATGYIYMAEEYLPGVVLKIYTPAMWTVDAYHSWVNANCRSLVYLNDYLYLGFNTTPAIVEKINATPMSYVSHWTGAPGENNVSSLTTDGVSIYAGLYESPGKVVKIDPDTMETISVWPGLGVGHLVTSLTSDGTYTYAGDPSNPANVTKITPGVEGINVALRHAWKQGYGRRRGSCPIYPPSEYGNAITSLINNSKLSLYLRTVNLLTGNFIDETIWVNAIE